MTSENTAAAFPIIGIGASAGGLEAFEQFFRNVSIDSGMAFVLVPHLDPSHASLLTDILQRTTRMPVIEAQEQIPVEPNRVYVIPPNRDMTIFHGKLLLSVPTEPRGQRMPIDTFLRSLAEDLQEKAVGIILSGTGTDGTLGLRAIFGAGGITLVQEPATAKYNGMPSSAIESGYASCVLPVDKMPETLVTGVYNLTGSTASSPAPGHATLNVIEMAREGLEPELRAAIRIANYERKPTLNKEVQVKTNGGFTTVSLSIRLLPGSDGTQNLLPVSFIFNPLIRTFSLGRRDWPDTLNSYVYFYIQ